MNLYNHKKIESKWQKKWEKAKDFEVHETSKLPKYYPLVEFPYPSGEGLHVGHIKSYTAMDIIARKRRAEGYSVLYPIGWDAFGLPTENYALKTGISPQKVTKKNTDNFRKQLTSLGFSFDWSREINTTDPKYYKWTQWIFLKLFEKGLAYKKKMPINWCIDCKIGLANEEVVDEVCERCGGAVEMREKEQWMLKITEYADRLDKDLDTVNYLEKIKIQQRNWIGRSEGVEIEFKLKTQNVKFKNTTQKSKVVMVHGCPGDEERTMNSETRTYDKHWQPWIEKKLVEKGFDVVRPLMPDPWAPEYQAWKKEFEKIGIDRDSIVIGHSCGGSFLLRYFSENKIIIQKLILVSPAKGKRDVSAIDLFYTFDVDQNIKNRVGEIVIFTSDNDYLRDEVFSIHKHIGGKLIDIHNYGHFVEDEMHTTEFPELLEEIFPRDPAFSPDASVTLPAVTVFTTRPDTLFGATYLVLAPEHPLLKNNELGIKNYDEVVRYIVQSGNKSDIERLTEKKEKTGIELKGITAINPVNQEKIPVWIADYVLAHYGTGAIMAVPAHDERDFEFAVRYNLPVRQVISPQKNAEKTQIFAEAYVGEGFLVNSAEFSGLTSGEAKSKIIAFVQGKKKITYKLRDWVFSRQRYWGEPIPLVFCEACKKQTEISNFQFPISKQSQRSKFSKGELLNPGWFAVGDDSLPVELPKVKKYKPTDTGESPLAAISKWVNTTCPKCRSEAKRETDTMPNWAGSSWYYLAYVMRGISNFEFPISKYKEVFKKWLPVDWYNGGMEHTTLHLLYSRFWHKFLFDIGAVPTLEPYAKRTSHGVILAENGEKMSKSKGNVVNPDTVVKIVGADSLRLYEMFMGPFSEAIAWNTQNIAGVRRFIERVYALAFRVEEIKSEGAISPLLHQTIKKVGDDIEVMKFNTAISQMMIFLNVFEKEKIISKDVYKIFVRLLAPFAPHVTEEIWKLLGGENSIHKESWPLYDEEKTVDTVMTIVVQVNGRVRGEFQVSRNEEDSIVKEKAQALDKVQGWVQYQTIKKVIYVPGKLVNIVTEATHAKNP